MSTGRSNLLTVRAHTLLCLQGFRGEGYSPAFVENMGAIHRRLSTDPKTAVRVIARPDEICSACPHLHPDGCHLKGPGFEAAMNRQDQAVMARLGIAEGEILSWERSFAGSPRASKGAISTRSAAPAPGCRWGIAGKGSMH
ncbi:MAG: DUF1284 domain-containing protein [Candidatus Manganitrophus sp.]|nr:MAG: DUF1284 domain-containing protein [Candidatus Manganitrophus sp.]